MFRSLHGAAGALLALALVGCTTKYKPDVSTETGNPPAIDVAKVALLMTGDEVHVRGEPGAVTPPKGQVEVTIVRTEDVTRGPVDDDGSFDIEVDATLNDVFEVRAVQDGERSNAAIVVRDSVEISDDDGGMPTCQQVSLLGSEAMHTAIAAADRSCETDDDCMVTSSTSECRLGCEGDYLSAEGVASVDALRQSLSEGLCAGFEGICGGEIFEPPCGPTEPATCDNGTCRACEMCFEDELAWVVVAPGVLPALFDAREWSLRGCDLLLTHDAVANYGCFTEDVAQCPNSSGPVPIASLNSALAHEDVVAAFERGGSFGEPTEQSGLVYQLTLNGQTITYNSCAGESAGVTCEPNGLEELVDLLERFRDDYACEYVTPTKDCVSDLQAGECGTAIPAYWHNPRTQACERVMYSGCGGGITNLYESRANCEATCPPPLSIQCSRDRVFADDVCLECGSDGACAKEGTACFLKCDENADCVDEKAADGTSVPCQDGMCWAPLTCL